MSARRKQQIRDRNGRIMFEGSAPSLKEFVEAVVRQGGSLARADLRRRDLSGLDLAGVDFAGAMLDGADLRGMVARSGSFVGASMRGVVAQGLLAEHGQFQGADLGPDPEVASRHFSLRGEGSVPSHFEGARLTYSNFSGAVLDGAVFDQATMSRSLLFHARANGASFRATRMYDVAFGFGAFVSCDFKDAFLTSTTGIEPAHLPDRTAWMTVASCSFEGAELDATVPAFSRDRRWSKVLKALAYTVSSVAIFSGMHHFHVGESASLLGEVLKSGTTLVLATTLAVAAKDMVAERVRDVVEHHLGRVDRGLRSAGERAIRKGANLKEMVMASVRGPGVRAVWNALKQTRDAAEKRGFFGAFWESQDHAGSTVIFVDRRHLAVALEVLCSGELSHRMQGDLVLVQDGTEPGVPALIRYKADGATSLAFVRADRTVGTADYDREGVLVRADEGLVADAVLEGHFRGFEEAALRRHGIDLKYDRGTHEIRAGQDGSILLMNRSTRRIGNPLDAALVKPDGSKVVFRDGKPADGLVPPADDAPDAGRQLLSSPG